MSKGFSIIEFVLVFVIIATLSVALILNFRVGARTATARLQTASAIISDVRRAQSMALAGTRYQGIIVCGYGVHYVSKSFYQIYAKPVPGGGCSVLSTRNYESGTDSVVETKSMINQSMELRAGFGDIFFEPPNPRVYVNNVSAPPLRSTNIVIQTLNQSNCAAGSCTVVEVFNSGQVDLR